MRPILRCRLPPSLRGGPRVQMTSPLCPQNFLNLPDFLLDFPAYLLVLSFGFQVGIVRHLSNLFLNLTLHFVNLARYFILRTWLHFVASFGTIRSMDCSDEPSSVRAFSRPAISVSIRCMRVQRIPPAKYTTNR